MKPVNQLASVDQFEPSNAPLSRRCLLKRSAATMMGTLLLGATAGFADDATPAALTDEYGGLPMGVQSYTLRSMSFEKALGALAHDLNLTRVEIYPGHLTGMSPPQALEKLKAAGVVPVAYGVIPFSKDIEKNRKLFDLAKTFGMKNLTCDPDPDAFDSLDKLTEEYDINAAIHDHGPGHRWGKIDVIHKAIKDHSKKIGLCNDTGHFIRAGEDPLRACEVFKDRMHGMHLKDFKKDAKGNFQDCLLGDGSLDVAKVIKFLIDNQFRGPLSLEYEGGDPVATCQKALGRVKEAVKQAKA